MQIEADLYARWGYSTTDEIEYVYFTRRSGGTSQPTKFKFTWYEAEELKNELSRFAQDLQAHAATIWDPKIPFPVLSRFPDTRNIFEEPVSARVAAVEDPDFVCGNVNGRYFAKKNMRRYNVILINAVSEKLSARFNGWRGPSIQLGSGGVMQLIAYIEKASAEIRAARAMN